jgi:hypothetical protein
MDAGFVGSDKLCFWRLSLCFVLPESRRLTLSDARCQTVRLSVAAVARPYTAPKGLTELGDVGGRTRQHHVS